MRLRGGCARISGSLPAAVDALAAIFVAGTGAGTFVKSVCRRNHRKQQDRAQRLSAGIWFRKWKDGRDQKERNQVEAARPAAIFESGARFGLRQQWAGPGPGCYATHTLSLFSSNLMRFHSGTSGAGLKD